MNRNKLYIIVFAFLFCILPKPTHAAVAWGTLNIVGDMTKQMMEEVSRQVYDALNSSLKMAAIKQATSTIETLLYGSSSSQANIRNYQSFLIEQPHNTAVAYAENFLTTTLQGTASGDYISSGGSINSTIGNALETTGQAVIDNLDNKTPLQADYAAYCEGDDFFATGDYTCFSAIFNNPSANTIYGIALETEKAYGAAYQQEQFIQKMYATSDGSLPILNPDGSVKVPKSVVEALQLQQVTLPLEALANGDSGVFSTAIQSFAVALITDVIEQGVGEVEQNINDNVAAFHNQYLKDLDNIGTQVGPAVQYSNDIYTEIQKAQNRNQSQGGGEPWINPDTGQPAPTPGGENKPWINPDTGQPAPTPGSENKPWINPDTGQPAP